MTSDVVMRTHDLTSAKPVTLADAVKASNHVALVDCSGSMAEAAFGGSKRKIDALRDIMYSIRQSGIEFRQIVFGTGPTGVEWREDIPEPSGDTPLADAIKLAGQDGKPELLVVISDGLPNDVDAALKAAEALGVRIDTFYVGPPGSAGEAFMRRLSGATGGSATMGNLGRGVKALHDGVARSLLALPPASGPIAL